MSSKNKIDLGLKDQLGGFSHVGVDPNWSEFKITYDHYKNVKIKKRKFFVAISSLLLVLVAVSLLLANNYTKNNTTESNNSNSEIIEKLEDNSIEEKNVSKTVKTPKEKKVSKSIRPTKFLLKQGASQKSFSKKNTIPDIGQPLNSTSQTLKQLFDFHKIKVFPIETDYGYATSLASVLPSKEKIPYHGVLNQVRRNTSISLNATTSYSIINNSIDENKLNQFHEDYELLKNDSEKPGLSYSIGANFTYYLNNRFSINSGIYFTSLRQQLIYNHTNYKIPVIDKKTNEILGYINSLEGNDLQLNHTNKFNHLEMPFIFSYNKPIGNRLNMVTRIGGAVFYQFSTDAYQLNFNQLTLDKVAEKEIQQWNYGIIGGIGVDYQLSDFMSIIIEPSYKRMLKSINTSNNYNLKPITYGINTTLQIYF